MPDRPTIVHQRDRLDRVIELASGATAAGMFAYGVALSYSVLHAIARAAGLPPWAARLWPLGFEAFMASTALNALAEQRHRRHLQAWSQRVPWYPWALTAGASILLSWLHPAIPLDPPPGWLVSLVYGLPPLAAVFAWHLFLQRLAHRHHQDDEPIGQDGTVPLDVDQDQAQDGEAGEPREVVRALLAGETPDQPGRPGRHRAVPLPRLRRPARAARRDPAATATRRPSGATTPPATRTSQRPGEEGEEASSPRHAGHPLARGPAAPGRRDAGPASAMGRPGWLAGWVELPPKAAPFPLQGGATRRLMSSCRWCGRTPSRNCPPDVEQGGCGRRHFPSQR
jgi:hypothetical protein